MDATVAGFGDSPLMFEQLVQSINEVERILEVPYPSPSVTMQRVSKVTGGFCGHNQMSYVSRYIGDPYVVENSTIQVRVDDECDETFASIAHEVAHTWFHGNDLADWIDEGLANAIKYQVVAIYQEGQVIYPPVTYCDSYRNIGELERGSPDRLSNDQPTGFRCNYHLGDGIFGALREYYGDNEFNERIATLARRGVNDTNREYTIPDIRKVLGGDGPALDIINRWYDGEPEMRKYLHFGAVTWTYPPTIDGDYLHFAGVTNQPGVVHDFVLGDDPYCSQFPLFVGVGDIQGVASVADPLLAGRHYSEIPKVVVINYQINPDTSEFSVTAKINNNALDSISNLSLSVRSRVTTGADGHCNESINYSQVPVVSGSIPTELKVSRHYHLDAIQWISPPTISGNTLRFVGKALPGVIHLTWQEGYCSQFHFYERNEGGYQYIHYLNLLLPAGHHWTGKIVGEVTAQQVSNDGTFEALVKLNGNALAGYPNPILLVKTQAEADSKTNKCGESDVLSAVDIR